MRLDSTASSADIFEYETPAIQPLKLHSSLQKAVDLLATGASWDGFADELVVYYRPEIFGETTEAAANFSTEVTPSEYYFSERIAAVRTINLYDLMEMFKNFFWTAPSTKDFFQSADEKMRSYPGFDQDEATFRLWQLLQMNAIENYEGNRKVCPFRDIQADYQSVRFETHDSVLNMVFCYRVDDGKFCDRENSLSILFQ